MGRVSMPQTGGFYIFNDRSFSPEAQPFNDDNALKSNQFAALRQLRFEESQNRQTRTSSCADVGLSAALRKLYISNKNHQVGPDKPTHQHRLSRPAIASDTFKALQTVTEDEDESQISTRSAAGCPSGLTQHYLEFPVGQAADHPLVTAARNIPSTEEQLARHRDGRFEWILSIIFPGQEPVANCNRSGASTATEPEVKKVFFGCNLLPSQNQITSDGSMKNIDADTYILLVTPIDENEEAVKMELQPSEQENTIRAEARMETATPRKPSAASREDGARPLTPSSAKSSEGHDRPTDDIVPGSPTRSSRIEDSVEALDQLEEELEAFDRAAHFHQMTSSEMEKLTSRKSPRQTPSAPSSRGEEATTPQKKRKSVMKTSPATLRANSTTEPARTPWIRKSVSLTSFKPDSRVKGEEKPPPQAPLSNTTVTRPATLNRPKQPAKSTKPPTIPSFELPGAVTARRLKEQREARLAIQAAAEQAQKPAAQASSIRRTKSVRASVVPTFELPGEAISRRKREQREAQLKAQEEEERKRREFKARPVRSGATPGTYPRGTIASRARQQQKSATTENSRARQAPSSPGKGDLHPGAHSPLSSTPNESQPQGLGPDAEPSAASHLNRAASHTSSTDSGKRSVLSAEDLEQQRLRGQVIYKRDNSFSEEREREKQHREALAKLAREEAAERSRQQSREWAAKKLRKRMTIASLRDIAA